jgi:hypothetical protein
MERISQYLRVESERGATDGTVPPAASAAAFGQRAAAAITFDGVTARYEIEGGRAVLALSNVSVAVRGGEKVRGLSAAARALARVCLCLCVRASNFVFVVVIAVSG